jgi:hypothetical protein
MKFNLTPRRMLATAFLLLAVSLLLAGETVLKDRLGPVTTLLYWLSCLLVTVAAILCALVDALRSFSQVHRDQRTLLEQTLREIEAERARRQKTTTPPHKSR